MTTPEERAPKIEQAIFRAYEATHVSVKTPDGETFLFEGTPREIVLDTGKYVWVHSSYCDELPPEVKQVGDGRDNGWSHEGNRIVSVPAEWCTFHSPEEAENIERMIEADQQLLRYAK